MQTEINNVTEIKITDITDNDDGEAIRYIWVHSTKNEPFCLKLRGSLESLKCNITYQRKEAV